MWKIIFIFKIKISKVTIKRDRWKNHHEAISNSSRASSIALRVRPIDSINNSGRS